LPNNRTNHQKYYHFVQGIYDELDEKAKEKVDSGETILIDSEYGKLPIRKNFFLNSRKLEFDLKKPIEVKCPIR